MKRIILASKSPRRKELLAVCGYDFECLPSDVDETINEDNDLVEEIKKLSRRKAEAIFNDNKDAIVVGGDTIVVLNNKILGKPKDRKESKEMIKALSGNTHQVITGICIMSSEDVYEDYTVSNVTFMEMSEEEIDEYVESGEGDDKAGAYAIQGIGAKFIKNIDGDYYSIMGFPLNKVYTYLRKLI